MGLTQAQQEAVATLKNPLFIQAGAGTGKTHTLTHRLVFAFSEESDPSGEGAILKNAEEFITITFTNKAAGELLGRIRTALRNEGLEEEALEVDSAWISTIHSMCKRILVEHALETSIDATATLIDEVQQKYILSEAYNRFLQNHEEDERLQVLTSEYSLKTVREHILGLAEAVVLEREGFSKISLGPRPLSSPSDVSPLVRTLMEQLEVVQGRTQEIIASGNKNKGPQTLVEYCENTIASLKSLERNIHSVYKFASELKPPSVKGDALDAVADETRDAVAVFLIEVMMIKQRIDLESFLLYSNEVVQDFSKYKRSNSLIDNDELLARAFSLLSQRADVAQSYQDKFRLVMVDEFQDTDRLQVGIIEQLVPEDLSTLATVGDRQQSIYGFRGADVTVFNEQQQKMEGIGGKNVSLDSNFRSHDQILRFVDDLFGQDRVFGNQLISLKHGRSEEEPYVSEDEPRIQVLMAAGEVTNQKYGTNMTKLRQDKARMIAKEFKHLKTEQGIAPNEMVILLRSMSNVDLYMNALQKEGFEPRIAGGSTFFQTEEVLILTNYLRALANPFDNPVMLATLISPLYNASDTELYALAGKTNPYEGLKSAEGPALRALAERFDEALKASDQMSTAQLLRREVERSGWSLMLATKGSVGMMVLANIYKFIELVREQESSEGVGLAKTATYFDGLLKAIGDGTNIKSNPGVLQESDTNAVRIMTIHSAKGLEFPVVAVAEFEGGTSSEEKNRYIVQDSDGIYPSIKVQPSYGINKATKKKATKWEQHYWSVFDSLARDISKPSKAITASGLYRSLRLNAAEQGEAEDKRVFYVACTRAREILIISTCDKSLANKSFLDTGIHEGLLGDLETAFFKHDGLPRGQEEFVRTFAFGAADNAPEKSGVPEQGYTGIYRYHVHTPNDEVDSDVTVGKSSTYGEETREAPLSLVSQMADDLISAPIIDTAAFADGRIDTKELEKLPKLRSYSSIAAEAHSAQEPTEPERELQELEGEHEMPKWGNEVAINFGLAFHLAAQKWILSGFDTSKTRAEINTVAQTFNLDAEGKQRLAGAFDAWTLSERAKLFAAQPLVFAEYPFVVPLEGSVPLQGSIDALGINRTEKKAFIIDYKTGTHGEGEADVLKERYKLQATCYAYAVLQSFAESEVESVELAFVRPEVSQGDLLEETCFSFSRGEVFDLS